MPTLQGKPMSDRLPHEGRLRTSLWLGVVAVAAALLVGCAPTGPAPTPTLSPEEQQVEAGRVVYGDYCITCHGESGSGLEEARTRFPDTHKRCERCHFQSLPPVPEYAGDPFAIGDPPDLRMLVESGRFGSRGAVYEFIRVSMPRWSPGMLADEEYESLSYYLWEVIGRTSDSASSPGEGIGRLP